MTKPKFDLDAIRKYLVTVSKESKIYLGCDSERFKKNGVWYANYSTVIVVHINSKHGCKIFGQIDTERDYDQKKGKPNLRLMNEVYRVSGLYLELQDVLRDRDVELHLDINSDPKYASSDVVKQAMGYVKGTTNIEPKIKPVAFCSSYCADRFPQIYSERRPG